MFSFHLSAEQQEFRDTVKDFVKREVKPVANHPDRLQAEDPHFVPAILEQADTTVWLEPGFEAKVDAMGNLLVTAQV